MGAWRYKALESDDGFDTINYIEDYIEDNYSSSDKFQLDLGKLIQRLQDIGALGKSFDDIDFYYDNTAMALVELFFIFKDDGYLHYGNGNEIQEGLKLRLTEFKGDKLALGFLLRYMQDMINEVPDEDGERESVELWRDSNCFEEWKEHLNMLAKRLEQELK
ncbi:DUF4259 domain-containing protein [Myroides odoratimimus]|uniref:DUF4259 domain-containing protein n=3 Tax=Myroides odoratimimus TaxID=76832 RepID=A0AAI8G5Z0_9FLAO|nr:MULTISPECIES: DUF4259 domain-containing protein [Myroides]ALU27246.1 hypothetical protein AS202_14225 [Myroides odoratimimus]EHO08407.1 hypothetical protein HMPREF9712_02069 [Myroides odoratimimus CCUG 10230]MCA4792373.1 DUF4259 domain-containing protein [Myroides odoratimimus]MCA4807043.1 DUF4259 domain-containing protein [Myroides odoratimimus]MCA4819635.1 DUF4259 domain-containing protein [Myroides odoratimimus]